MIQTVIDRFRSRQLERHFVVTLILVALGAMIISLMIGLQQSVWFDEAYSILLAKQPVMSLVHLTSMDTHPPLYYLLLKGWAMLFGWSELALRSLSVFAMGGAIVLGGLLIKKMFGVRVAIISLPFAALSPFLLRYGFEIRMYALASLIGMAATYTLVVALETKDRARQWKLYTLYAVLVAIGVYTLYYTVLLWIAHFIWLSWRSYQEKKPVIKSPWFAAFAGSVLLFLPWLPMLISQVGNGALAAISQQVTLDNLSGIVSFAFLYMPAWELDGYTTVIVLFVISVIGIVTAKAFKAASKKERSYLALLVSYTLVPVILIALLSLVRPMYVERYISHVLIGGMLFIGVGAAYATKKASPVMSFAVGALSIVLLLGVGELSEVGNYNFQRLQEPAVKAAAASIGTCSKNTTIFAADPYVATELSYYLSSCEIRFYSASDTLRGGFAPFSNSPLRIASPAKQLGNSPKLVYVYYGRSQLLMPPLLIQVSHHVYGSMNVDTFITR